MARASLREHLASREGFAAQREEQTAQIQALMQTNAEQAADAERHRLELHAVRVAAADTGAERHTVISDKSTMTFGHPPPFTGTC